ncbi:MAG: AAA family ATPase [Xanthobacteraceae bacterium]
MTKAKAAPAAQGPVALKNVAGFMAMTQRLVDRGPLLPGIGVCQSVSGYGKTLASIFAQNKTGAARVEIGDTWTRKTTLKAILRELGVFDEKKRLTIADMAELAVIALGNDPSRPLIIDEADKLVDKGMIELVRELHEHSGAPVILIGEERLPAKLLNYERVHNRVLEWFPAQPCDLEDAKLLAHAFAPKIAITDDLLDAIRAASGGRARRIVVNISRVAELARNQGKHTIDLRSWGDAQFYTSEPPQARSVPAYERAPRAA